MKTYIIARRHQTPVQAWEESEGLFICDAHSQEARQSLGPEQSLIDVPIGIAAEVLANGQCEVCWDEWAEAERQRYESDAAARWAR